MRISIQFFILMSTLQVLLILGTGSEVFQRTRLTFREEFARDTEQMACAIAKSIGGVTPRARDSMREQLVQFTANMGLAFVSVHDLKTGIKLSAGDESQAQAALGPEPATEDEQARVFTTYCEGADSTIEVAVGRSYENIVKAENSVGRTFVQLIGVQLSLLLLLAAAMALFVHRRARRISEACERISSGEFSARVRITGNDEIAGIGRNINSMAEKLEENQRRQLEQAKVDLTRSKFVALGEMAGGVAHEINTPLNIILLRAGMAKKHLEGIGGENARKIVAELEKITDVVGRISRIVRGLRSFSRDSSRDPMEIVSFRTCVEDAMSLCHEKLRAGGVSVSLNCPQDLLIRARATEITQVLLNLLSNSHYATKDQPEGWIRIDVSGTAGEVRARIVDSGPPIAADVADRMMDPFFTNKPVGEGSGLGLSISLGIARAHGGNLAYLRDEPNTTFEISLPRALAGSRVAA